MTQTRDTNVNSGILAKPPRQRHPRTVARVRVAVAIWLLTLAGIFCSRGYYRGAALAVPAALHLWLAFRRTVTAWGQH